MPRFCIPRHEYFPLRLWQSQKLIRVRISDTFGPGIILPWYFLARHSEDAEKIHKELTSIDTHDITALSTLSHLNGVVNESMRLLPAALSTGTRVTLAEYLHIEDTFIPGNTKIAAPCYSIFRRQSPKTRYSTHAQKHSMTDLKVADIPYVSSR